MTPIDARGKLAELPFSYRVRKSGEIQISWQGRVVTTIRGLAAEQFLARMDQASDDEAQHLMARATGNFKHGNERHAQP